MQNKLPLHLRRRCGARTRSGSRCRSPAMPNGRCRLHGGMSLGAPKGNKNALKHGRCAAGEIAIRREIAALLQTMRALARAIEEGE
ncbi:MAG: HGGxSTG domain-containing protein [Methylocella sp.]